MLSVNGRTDHLKLYVWQSHIQDICNGLKLPIAHVQGLRKDLNNIPRVAGPEACSINDPRPFPVSLEPTTGDLELSWTR